MGPAAGSSTSMGMPVSGAHLKKRKTVKQVMKKRK